MVWRVSEEENVEVTAILGESYDEIENDALRIGFVICRRAQSSARLGHWMCDVIIFLSKTIGSEERLLCSVRTRGERHLESVHIIDILKQRVRQ